MIAYDLKATYLKELCYNIKNENKNTDSSLNGSENYVGMDSSNQTYNELIKFCKLKGIKLTKEQLSALKIPNTQVFSLFCNK